jgi:hypothetical protein
VEVNLVDVWIITELRGDVDRLENAGDHLGGQRHVRRQDQGKPEREPEANGQDLHARTLEPKAFGDRITTGKEELGFLTADRHHRDDRDAAFNGSLDVARAATEVDDVLGPGRPIRVVVAAGKDEHHRALA